MNEIPTAKIALAAAPYAIDKPYDYALPPELAERAQPGMRVIVPFGAGNRRSDGLILALGTEDRARKLKSVITLLDENPVLDAQGIALALWMSRRCFCTVYDCAKAMLPAGLWFTLRDSYHISNSVTHEQALEAAGKSEAAKNLVEILFANEGTADLSQIRTAFGIKNPAPAMKLLADQGIITLESSASRGVGDKSEQLASLSIPAEEALAQVTPKRGSAPLRYAVVELLATVGTAATKEICYFTGASNATIKSLVKSGLLTLEKQETFRRVDIGPIEPAGPLTLTEEQQTAFLGLDALCREEKPAAALLYGITGSGKTQVYIRLIEETLKRGKTAMVLVPEIALTPQLLRIFTSYFGEKIAILHSSLRAGERYDEWKRIQSGRATVVLGTRSAVFAPLQNIGLIVLDEEQEYTYKSENVPRYHARDVAKFRCNEHKALLLLGSATPSVESMYCARNGVYSLFTLHRRFNEQALPSVLISDRKEDLRQGIPGDISSLLHRELAENIRRGEQSILFLNRRGASRMVACSDCGAVPTCPRCSVYLTYHSANNRLMCHHCGHSERLPETCPQCGGRLEFHGTGTQKVQQELEELFPGVEVMRMDTDTVTATQSHDKLFTRFEQEKIPILVGTQMVAKGLDFENVTLVGVIAADLSLYVDDFRAAERTFSLLTQVVGRAGRGEKKGRAVIQTYTPDNEVIRFAASQDYDSFYDEEIHMRALRGCPPFQDVFVLTASGINEAAVLRACQRLRISLDTALAQPPYSESAPQLLGPAPAAVAKVNNRYRYRLTLSCKNTKEMRALIAHLIRSAQQDKVNKGVSIFADYNPMD
ncbi:MAG: primosomal protein N' [Oscillospiraceae bacterium]